MTQDRSILIFVTFFAPQSKKTITTAMVGSGAERRGEAKRRRETRHVRALSGVIPPIKSGARACSRAGRSRSEVEARSGAQR